MKSIGLSGDLAAAAGTTMHQQQQLLQVRLGTAAATRR
jgi:hypothetical protein